MNNEVDYIIKKDSRTEYSVVKFLNGEFSQEYRVARYETGLECSCLSGMYRGYCKHKDWVGLVERNGILPNNVELEQKIDQEFMDNINNILKGG